MEAVMRSLHEINSMTGDWMEKELARDQRILAILGDRSVNHLMNVKLEKPEVEQTVLLDVQSAAKRLGKWGGNWLAYKLHCNVVEEHGRERLKIGYSYDGTTVWWTHDGQIYVVQPSKGRAHGHAKFSRKSKVNRAKLILWFINSREPHGATFKDIQRFICELNGYNYDRMVPEPKFKTIRTGERESSCEDLNCIHHSREITRHEPNGYRWVRANRGYYCDYLRGNGDLLGKYCTQYGDRYRLNDDGRKYMLTGDPKDGAPQLPVVLKREFAEHEEEV